MGSASSSSSKQAIKDTAPPGVATDVPTAVVAAGAGDAAQATMPVKLRALAALPASQQSAALASLLMSTCTESHDAYGAMLAVFTTRSDGKAEELAGVTRLATLRAAEESRWASSRVVPAGVNGLPFPVADDALAALRRSRNGPPLTDAQLAAGTWDFAPMAPFDANAVKFPLRVAVVAVHGVVATEQVMEVDAASLREAVHADGTVVYDGVVDGEAAWEVVPQVQGLTDAEIAVFEGFWCPEDTLPPLDFTIDSGCAWPYVTEDVDVIARDTTTPQQDAVWGLRAASPLSPAARSRRLERMAAYFTARLQCQHVAPVCVPPESFFVRPGEVRLAVMTPEDVPAVVERHRQYDAAVFDALAAAGEALMLPITPAFGFVSDAAKHAVDSVMARRDADRRRRMQAATSTRRG